jgi:hypothetical protein
VGAWLAVTDNETQVILAAIGFLGLVTTSALTAWVAVKVHRVDRNMTEIVPLVKATDNAINGEGTNEATSGEIIRSTGLAVGRLEVEGQRSRGAASDVSPKEE